jgi:WD40 repeat protein
LLAIEDAKALGKSTPFSPAQIDRMRVSTLACLALSDLRTAETWHDDWSQAYFPLSTDQQQTIYAYPSGDHEVFVHRTKDGAEVARIQSLGPHAKPMLSPDGSKLALVNDFCRVFRLDSEPPELIFETATQGSWSFLPSGQQMVGTDGSGAFSLVDLDLRKVIKNYGRLAVQKEIAISPDSKWAALLVDQSVQVIALETGNICFQVDSPSTAGEKHFAWHPNSNILAVGPYLNDGIVLWDVSTGTRLTSFFHNAGEMNFCFNSTGDLLLTYDAWAGSMYLWNVTSGALELSKFGNSLFAISANNEGGFDMLQLLNGTDLSSLAIEHSQIYHTLPMLDTSTFIVSSNDLAYCADGRFLAIASNGNVQIFDSEKLTLLGQVVTGQCFIRFDDEGSLLTLNELGLNRWGVKVHKQSNPTTTASNFRDVEFGPPQFIGQALANANFDVSRNGKTVAVPDSDGALIWSANQPKPVRTIGSHPDVRDVSISADGQRLATGGWNGGKACIWNAQTGELLHMIDEPNCCLIRFSPDGRRLVTNSNEVTIWDAATWLPIAKVAVPGRSVSGVCVRFSPDSSMLAVSDSQACIHLINPTDGSKIATLTDPNRHFVSRMTFSPNGQQLAVLSSAAGGLVHIWDLVAIRRQLRQRNLDWSPAEPITPPQQASLKFIDNDSNIAGPVSKISFVADARFSQLEASEQVRRAQLAAEKYDLPSARAAIRRAIELQPRVPFACNELAWLLTTGPLSLRDPVVAVELAKRAWHDESNVAQKALYINTLGVALYRAEKIPEAIEALEQSLAMQPPESQPFDLYFLSMCSARLHELEKSRGYFEKAESLVNQYNVTMPRVWRTELAQFSQEALSLLGDAKE